jgi:RNA polymerase sigma-70 factor (ECF subfamily)
MKVQMPPENEKEREFTALLDNFAGFIRFHILKFNLGRFGLDPDDISQDVRLRLWKLLNAEKKVDNYASYIKKIVDSAVIDQLRRWKREEGIFRAEKNNKIAELELIYNPEIERLARLKEIISRSVESLIPSRKQVVKLYLLGMNTEEIAAYLGWSQDKTRNLLYRGLADLKNRLRERDIEYEG